MLRLLVFKMQTLNVHLIKLRTYDSNDAAPPPPFRSDELEGMSYIPSQSSTTNHSFLGFAHEQTFIVYYWNFF